MFLQALQDISTEKRRKVMCFALFIFIIYALIIIASAMSMYHNRSTSQTKHALRMSATAVEPGHTQPDILPETGEYTSVKMGTYIENIDNMSIKDSFWTSIFYVWYSWKGDAKLDPGGKMVIVDGSILKKDRLEDYHDAEGRNYQRYRVAAKMIKFF